MYLNSSNYGYSLNNRTSTYNRPSNYYGNSSYGGNSYSNPYSTSYYSRDTTRYEPFKRFISVKKRSNLGAEFALDNPMNHMSCFLNVAL